jgi:hypothetical protein
LDRKTKDKKHGAPTLSIAQQDAPYTSPLCVGRYQIYLVPWETIIPLFFFHYHKSLKSPILKSKFFNYPYSTVVR